MNRISILRANDFARSPRSHAATILCAIALLLSSAGAAAQYTLLHQFSGQDGANPACSMIRDSAGNLYGTTQLGGTANQGVVFRLTAPSYTETVLWNFTGGGDGAQPWDGLSRDSAGNLYGTTSVGGGAGHGTVFELTGGGVFKLLHTFTGGADGGNPYGGVILDSSKNLYGTTFIGGTGFGVVFRLNAASAYSETVLHTFSGGNDGGNPFRGLIRDSSGNVYGSTEFGGASGNGVVFELKSPTFKETVLYTFTGGADGKNPIGFPIRDSSGNLYGTTAGGGAGFGVIYKLTAPSFTESVLYSFTGGADGANPLGFLYRDSSGNLYGTAHAGGGAGDGVIFELGASFNVLHTFAGSDGNKPYSALIRDSHNNFYGTTQQGGGGGDGVVFKLN